MPRRGPPRCAGCPDGTRARAPGRGEARANVLWRPVLRRACFTLRPTMPIQGFDAHSDVDHVQFSPLAPPESDYPLLVHRRRLSLRTTLLSLLVGLLVVTVASLAGLFDVNSSRSVAELEARYFRTIS